MTDNTGQKTVSKARFLLPLFIVAALTVMFYIALYSGDKSRVPSVMIGKPVPEFSLPPIEGMRATGKNTPGFESADLANGEVSVVNVWASWCAPCIQEHPLLVQLKKEHDLRLVGINYKDKPDAAKSFLTRLGNPFDALGADRDGRVAIDWGVYGVPETYIVNGQGEIIHKVVGPLSEETIEDELLPLISRARQETTPTASRNTS